MSVKDSDNLEKYKKKFDLIDTDGDGYFTLDDYLAFLYHKKINHSSVEAAIYKSKTGIHKVKKKTKELTSAKELKFQKTIYIRVSVISKTSTENKQFKEFLYRPYYENNSITLKCFDHNGETHFEEYDLDFTKMPTVEIIHLEEEDKKNRYWTIWKLSCLPHEFACSSSRDLEEWTQTIRYLHNRVALSKARIIAAEVRGIAPKHSTMKALDPKLLEELNSLDPFAPGKSNEEKEAIWARINEIRDMIGDHDHDSSASHGFEDVSSEDSLDIEGDEEGEPEEEAQPEALSSSNSVSPLRLDVSSLKKAASKTGKIMAEKTKSVAEKTKEGAEVLSSRTAVSARSIKSSVGSVRKSVVNRVKGE